MTRRILMIVGCLASLSFGCSDAPKGFPKVVSCKITVVQGTKPLNEVDVILLPSSPMNSTMFFGKTDQSGHCQVATTFANYRKNGVPKGTYKVVLDKRPEIELTQTEEHACCAESHSMSRDSLKWQAEIQKQRKKHPQIIPDILTQSSSTPLTLDVSSNGATLAVNLDEYQ
ncbi:MAG: hypothetical protein LBJ67_07325 [Planctomycetaceae bacterium]|jgi:hypothetical protein|nr:hypothetical protein [Planctomycetaceae bacterium]